MSSLLWIINWAPEAVTPSLNTGVLVSVKPSAASSNYFPFSTSVDRDLSSSGQPSVWGRDNTFTVRPTAGGSTQIYNNLQNPEGAKSNIELLLWIFPEFLVFSQLDEQLGNIVRPSNTNTMARAPSQPRRLNMGTAYFINGTPVNVRVILNGGDQNKLAAISVAGDQKSVTGPTWGAEISAFRNPDVFGGSNVSNELVFNSDLSPTTKRYSIQSTVAITLDLYFFMFEDTIVGEDSTGSSKGITINLLSNVEEVVAPNAFVPRDYE